MTLPPSGDVTRLLERQAEGDDRALDQLVELVYEELCNVAHRQMRREVAGHTLDTRALVNEAYLRFRGLDGAAWKNRGHFFGVAGLAMKQILIQHARAKMAKKRGEGDRAVPIDEIEVLSESHAERLLLIDQLLGELETLGPRYRAVVEHRIFSGLTLEETAEAVGASLATVKRDWTFARAWLNQALAAS
ncbi:MAG: ECF-type sigma factor [Acidobacteriota bacterium]